jgi:hypothetical protein
MILFNTSALTSAPAAAGLERLSQYGFHPNWFANCALTSGEEASKLAFYHGSQLQTMDDKGRVLFWTWDDHILGNPHENYPPQPLGHRGYTSYVDEYDYSNDCYGGGSSMGG